MNKFRAGLVVAVIASLQAFALVVSAAPASAYAPPVTPDAPPRVTAPAPTTFKPPTTPVIPKTAISKLPISLALGLDSIVGDWLRSTTGNTSYPSMGCVVNGKMYQTTEPQCAPGASPAPVPQSPNPSGLVIPDLLWGALTGKNLNPLILGPAPANTSNIQITPTIVAGPAANKVTVSWTGQIGQTCITYPWFNECKGDLLQSAMGSAQTLAPLYIQCKLPNGSIAGPWTGSSNSPKGGFSTVSGHTVAGTTFTVCGPDQMTEYVKIKAKAAPAPGQNGDTYTPSVAPGVWINPAKDIWQDTTITSNLTCKNASGGSVTVSATSTGTGIAKAVQCPTGYLPDSGNTSIGNAFLDAPQKIEEWKILPETRETYADCIGWQSAGCILRVELDGVDCSPGNPACFDWAEIQRLQPSRVKCKWGQYELDISNCLPLRNGYQSESGIASAPSQVPGAAPLGRDVFGNPLQPNADPSAPPQWQPDYGTPSNPAPSGDPGPNPLVTPVPIPSLPPVPLPPGSPQPVPPPVTTTPNAGDSNCWPGGTAAFNPLEWVLQPVKCALSWAFVPQQATAQAQITRIQNSVGKVPVVASIGTVTTTIDTVGAAAGNGSGCTGPTFNFDFNEVHQEVQPFNACAEPVATMATISRSFSTVVVIVLGVLAAARAFGASMGFNFTMGKSS